MYNIESSSRSKVKSSLMDKVEASLMLASYFETIGFNNGQWEFNYGHDINDFQSYTAMSNTLLNHFIIQGGPTNLNIKKWDSSDDTILIIATMKAVINGGGKINYINEYVNVLDLLKNNKRYSGITTLHSIRMLQQKINIPISSKMGGNGAAMRTGPIGLKYFNNIEKVISESITASILTHNYYVGFLGGMITALFTAFAINNINKYEWLNKLLELYENKIIHKYYPKTHDVNDLDNFMSYWKKYKEERIDNYDYNNENIQYFNDRHKFLINFYTNTDIKYEKHNYWDKIASSGLDVCIFAYDCLLITNNLYSFMTLVCIHPGDNDTTGAIGGTWYGALNGYAEFDINKLKDLEFYKEIKVLLQHY